MAYRDSNFAIDPGLFRQLNELPGEVAVYGPYGGALDNGGEALRLLRPVATEAGKEPAWVLVDRVRYSDRAPWPATADG